MMKNGKKSRLSLILTGIIILIVLLLVLMVPSIDAANVAQGKTASASSSETANPAARGNDGSTTTRWCAANGNTGNWWKVDLGSSYNLTGTEVMWEFSGRVYKYRVETSADNSNWSVRVDKTNNTSTAQTQTDNFSASARYVRITVTGLASGTWASLFEFRVFSNTGSTPTPTRRLTTTPTPTRRSIATVTPTPSAALTPSATPPAGWRLVWSDEFNNTGRPDPANWGYEYGYVRNSEAQYYQEPNAWCEGGRLIIEARRNDSGYNYTSSSIHTRGKREFKYGRFELRGKIPCVTGSWPAWWTLGNTNSWPRNGEIDIMEYYRSMILANVAYDKGGIKWDSATRNISSYPADWSSQFHIWVMEWDTNTINLYVDGWLMNTFNVNDATDGTYNPFRNHNHYMLINLAIGGTNGGDPSGTQFPLRYEVDYVRVYQR